MTNLSRLTSLLAWLTKIYSPEFQRWFAHDMLTLFELQCEEVRRRRGRIGLTAFAARTFASVTFFGIVDRLPALMAEVRVRRKREGPMSAFAHDLRQGVRTMTTSPAFAIIAILTLALGIAVNATIFSLVSTLLFSELPVGDPDRFVFLWGTNERAGENRSPLTLREVDELRKHSESFSGVSALLEGSFVLTDDQQDPARVIAFRVTEDFHDVWGIDTVVGRRFSSGDDRPGGPPVVILSHGFWDRRFGRDPGVIGQVLELDGEAHTVIGVLSPQIEYGSIANVDVWLPLGLDLQTALPGERGSFTTARLRTGVNVERSQLEVALIASRLEGEDPALYRGWGVRVSPIAEELLNEEDEALVLVTIFSVGLVLLIACANVANLFMARATSRSREVAVRLALGADRGRLVRQLMTEGLVLAIVAASLGLILARGLLGVLIVLSSDQQWIYRTADLDRHVLAFTLGISLLTPLVFALAPSLRASRTDVAQALRQGGRSGVGRASLRSRGFLVAAQVAMALSLMIVTGLLVRTAFHLRQLDLGFETDGLLTVEIRLPERDYGTEDSRRRFYEELIVRSAAIPGVTHAAVVSHLPLSLVGPARPFLVEGAGSEEEERPRAQFLIASPDYFDTLGVPLVGGRAFQDSDTAASPRVAIVNKKWTERYGTDGAPLGTRIRLAEEEGSPWVEVVGVVGDVIDVDIAEASGVKELSVPQVYLPLAQAPIARMSHVLRTEAHEATLAGAVRANIRAIDPDLVVVETRTMKEMSEEIYASSNPILVLFLVFAAFALLMASMGIYGVTSYAVSQREQEIGIRIALGASRHDVSRMIVRQGGRLVLAGGVCGLALAWLLGRLLAATLIGVSPVDPLTFLTVPVVLVLVAFLANYVPALRATRVDPITALRAE
ncbi:MAG TPA: ABC transporter permease [Vicinamibacteria bacterium]|nr:ABC transporter permease [Vicinamibacteria bacterium]